MKKKNLSKKLQFKKIQISNLNKNRIAGGAQSDPCPILTANCTEFASCIDCLTDNCTRSCRPDVCPPIKYP